MFFKIVCCVAENNWFRECKQLFYIQQNYYNHPRIYKHKINRWKINDCRNKSKKKVGKWHSSTESTWIAPLLQTDATKPEEGIECDHEEEFIFFEGMILLLF